MDFRFAPEENAFRTELREFLAAELPASWEGWEALETPPPEHEGFAHQFRRRLVEKGWFGMAWPREFGGQNASIMRQMVFNEEMAYHRAPTGFSMGLAWVGPALMLFGTPEQKQRYLPPIVHDEEEWCTLYSEPGAGSDLAALQTRAERDGDEYVINGQKIWTSGGHRARLGWLAARTDPAAPKHKGISMFVVEMDRPGISIRPLVNMAKMHEFNEVFFDNVRIPASNLVGEENRGWYQLAVALDFERTSVADTSGYRRLIDDLASYAREHRDRIARPRRLQVVERLIEIEAATALAYRVGWLQSQGKVPNYEASLVKTFGAELGQRVALTGVNLLGLRGQLERGDRWAPLHGRVARLYAFFVSSTIAGGTSEVNRSVIATRGLGLPRE
ncbi:MAG: acyl-CoA dehydrogenase family protein [Thermoflexaceae bacterium]|nr:acyl-CoA dehydrogenase family protein [Thermoflexaceae bacterium]